MNFGSTIVDTCTLPSKCKVYDTPFNPEIELRSMTVEDEMLRLNITDKPFKLLSEIIDRCIVSEKLPISSYDMCLGDFQFLLTRLRMVSLGSSYKVSYKCRYCGITTEETIELGDLPVKEYDDAVEKYRTITLPRSGHIVTLRMQTPRMLDDIEAKVSALRKKSPNYKGDPAFLLSLQSVIDTVDGEKLDIIKCEDFVRSLSTMDANYINQCSAKLSDSIGMESMVEVTCEICGVENRTRFQFNNEFWMPDINI